MKLEAKLLIEPRRDIWWCNYSVGPSYFRTIDKYNIEAYITGRDAKGI